MARRKDDAATDDELRRYQATGRIYEEITSLLYSAAATLDTARRQQQQAETVCRVYAAYAVRARLPKVQVARLLDVSRPTLDAWLGQATADPDIMRRVVEMEYTDLKRAHERDMRLSRRDDVP